MSAGAGGGIPTSGGAGAGIPTVVPATRENLHTLATEALVDLTAGTAGSCLYWVAAVSM